MATGLAILNSTSRAGTGTSRAAGYRLAWLAGLALAGSASAAAHDFTITPVTIVLTGDGGFQAEIGLDADALALGLPLEADSEEVARGMAELGEGQFDRAVQRARDAVRDDIRIAFDSVPADFEARFPHHGTPAAAEADPPTVLGALARLTGRVPGGSRELTVRLPAKYKTVSLQIHSPSLETPSNVLLDPARPARPSRWLTPDSRSRGRACSAAI